METRIPRNLFPEMTLRASAVAPPIVTFVTLKQSPMPVWFPTGSGSGTALPAAFRPMKLPWMTWPDPPAL